MSQNMLAYISQQAVGQGEGVNPLQVLQGRPQQAHITVNPATLSQRHHRTPEL